MLYYIHTNPCFLSRGKPFQTPKKINGVFFFHPSAGMGRGVSRNLFKKIQISEFWDINFQSFENETNFEDAFKRLFKIIESGINYMA